MLLLSVVSVTADSWRGGDGIGWEVRRWMSSLVCLSLPASLQVSEDNSSAHGECGRAAVR